MIYGNRTQTLSAELSGNYLLRQGMYVPPSSFSAGPYHSLVPAAWGLPALEPETPVLEPTEAKLAFPSIPGTGGDI